LATDRLTFETNDATIKKIETNDATTKKETKAFDKSGHLCIIAGDTNTTDQWFWSISQGLKNIVKRKTKRKRPWKGISEKKALERHLRPIRRKSCCEYSRLLMLLLLVY